MHYHLKTRQKCAVFGHFCPVFGLKCPFFKCHSKTGPFGNQIHFNHSKTGLVRFSNAYWIGLYETTEVNTGFTMDYLSDCSSTGSDNTCVVTLVPLLLPTFFGKKGYFHPFPLIVGIFLSLNLLGNCYFVFDRYCHFVHLHSDTKNSYL